jgi:transcriptional regulator with XRE-family HTH domain
MVYFERLNSQLRDAVATRIASRQLTGLSLARKTGFRQAHISNYLHRRRGLSLDGMDRILDVLGLSVLDLIPAGELSERLPKDAADREYEGVALVDAAALREPQPQLQRIQEQLKFKRNFLRRLRPDAVTPRASWVRFLLYKASEEDGAAMYPRVLPRATLLIDRQYNSLRAYRRGDTNMYAVLKGHSVLVRNVEITGKQLTLRPEINTKPLDFIPIESSHSYGDYILGRVCHVSIET